MGLFGSSKKEAPKAADSGDLLNSEDLQHALDIAINLGNPPEKTNKDATAKLFDVPFQLKKMLWDDWLAHSQDERIKAFLKSDTYREAEKLVIKSLDMDGDGKITPKDFQIMYDSNISTAIARNSDAIDRSLPFIGQITFGIVVGLVFGSLTRRFYTNKYLIAGTGMLCYSGCQILAQENFVNQAALEAAFKAKVKELADVNGDGQIDRKDLNVLVENRMKYVATKLGPGGIAPGLAGVGSLALGFLRGVRFI